MKKNLCALTGLISRCTKQISVFKFSLLNYINFTQLIDRLILGFRTRQSNHFSHPLMDVLKAQKFLRLFRLPRIECLSSHALSVGKNPRITERVAGWTMLFLLKYVFHHAGTTCPISAFLPFLSVGLEDYISAFGANVEP